jgi:hypothetical protein
MTPAFSYNSEVKYFGALVDINTLLVSIFGVVPQSLPVPFSTFLSLMRSVISTPIHVLFSYIL